MSSDLQALLQQATARADANERRAAVAENQCQRYRGAFLQVLQEPFSDLDSTVSRLLEVLAITLDVDRVGFWMFDAADSRIRCTHQYQRRPPKGGVPTLLSDDEFPSYFAALSSHLMLPIGDAVRDPRTKELAKTYLNPLGVGAMLDVPVRAFGKYIGVICNEHIGGSREWTAEDQHFGAAVATQVALTFERDRVRRTQQRLLRRSLFDSETQLPNRIHLENDIGDALEASTAPIGVVIAHIDQYKLIVDTFGREQAVTLLKMAVERIAKVIPNNVTLARTGLGEVGMLVTPASPTTLTDDIKQWLGVLREPCVIGEEQTYFTMSTGVAIGHVGAGAEQLMTDAGLAMLQAQQAGGARIASFEPALRARIENRVAIEQDLRRGLAAQEFDVHFQPIVDLNSLQCVSMEALVRWRHAERGLLCPSEFIGAAMESGVILELGRRVLRSACEGLAAIRAQTQNPTLTVSVNMSAPEVLSPGMVELVAAELNRVGLFPDALTLEITETALIADLDHAAMALQKLRASGVRVSLDDFGTAFSSLSWLHKLPIDTVKIDRGYVEGIPNKVDNATLVRAIADLARSFNRGVIAEGVETVAQFEALRAMGVTLGQGFLFARAEPTERFTQAWLQSLASELRR